MEDWKFKIQHTEDILFFADRVLVKLQSEVLDGYIRYNGPTPRLLDRARSTDSTIKIISRNAQPDEEGVCLKEGLKKISTELMDRVLGTCEAYPHMEIGFVVYRNVMTGDWDIRVPEQTGAGATVSFFEEKHPDHKFQVTGSIHTHPEMGAFWSGTDMNTHTKTPGMVHWVFGLRKGLVNQMKCSYFFDDGTGKIETYDFDLVSMLEEEPDWKKHREPDPEWKKIIDKQAYKKPVIRRIELPGGSVYHPAGWGDWPDDDGWMYPHRADTSSQRHIWDSWSAHMPSKSTEPDEDDENSLMFAELEDMVLELAWNGAAPIEILSVVIDALKDAGNDKDEVSNGRGNVDFQDLEKRLGSNDPDVREQAEMDMDELKHAEEELDALLDDMNGCKGAGHA